MESQVVVVVSVLLYKYDKTNVAQLDGVDLRLSCFRFLPKIEEIAA